jgi:hypothetical protein
MIVCGTVSPYQDLEKATVLQECRVFNDSNTVTTNPRLCCQLITKLLHILTTVRQGHSLCYACGAQCPWSDGRCTFLGPI